MIITQLECTKGLKYLGIFYNKEYTQEECQVYYDFLQKYNYDVFRSAVTKIIETSKYLPKVADIIEACEKQKHNNQFEIIEYMKEKGYFKSPLEYDKTIHFLNEGIIPEWFKEHMKKYYDMLLKEKSGNLLQDSNQPRLLEA